MLDAAQRIGDDVDFDVLFSPSESDRESAPVSMLAYARPANGAPLPRLSREAIAAARADLVHPTVSNAGLDWFLDVGVGGSWCSECGGPCDCTRPVTATKIAFTVLLGSFLGILLGLAVAAGYIAYDSGDMRWLAELRKSF